MTVHASRELLEAMCGIAPEAELLAGKGHELCGKRRASDQLALAFIAGESPEERPEAVITIDCADCSRLLRASLPEETLVRLDYLETRLPPPRCPSCDFGPFIPMREADGFNHRAVAGSTHVCAACGKGWRP